MNSEIVQRIDDAKEFSISFAFSVSEVSAGHNDLIAKRGAESIYAVLQKIFPQVRILCI